MKKLIIALCAVMTLSGCGFFRLFSGSEVKVQNDTSAVLATVSWGQDVVFTDVLPGTTTEAVTTTTTEATIYAHSDDPAYTDADTPAWGAAYAGVYTIRIWTGSGSRLNAEIIAEEGSVGVPTEIQ